MKCWMSDLNPGSNLNRLWLNCIIHSSMFLSTHVTCVTPDWRRGRKEFIEQMRLLVHVEVVVFWLSKENFKRNVHLVCPGLMSTSPKPWSFGLSHGCRPRWEMLVLVFWLSCSLTWQRPIDSCFIFLTLMELFPQGQVKNAKGSLQERIWGIEVRYK